MTVMAEVEALAGIDCPPWCNPDSCTARGQPCGQHYSAKHRVEATGSEACSASVVLSQSPGHQPLVTLEMQHDPDISAALEMPVEPDSYVYSLSQAKHVWQALGNAIENAAVHG